MCVVRPGSFTRTTVAAEDAGSHRRVLTMLTYLGA